MREQRRFENETAALAATLSSVLGSTYPEVAGVGDPTQQICYQRTQLLICSHDALAKTGSPAHRYETLDIDMGVSPYSRARVCALCRGWPPIDLRRTIAPVRLLVGGAANNRGGSGATGT
jgi:hypothetical protein